MKASSNTERTKFLLDGSDYQYISVLRPPIERWVSYYNFCRVHERAGLRELALSCSLDEFLTADRRPKNVAARVFCGYSVEPTRELMHAHFELFSLVGLQDKFLETCFLLARTLGLRSPFPGHVGKLQNKVIDISQDSVQLLREQDVLDFELQALADENHLQSVAALTPSELDVLDAYTALSTGLFSSRKGHQALKRVLERGVHAERSTNILMNALDRTEEVSRDDRKRLELVFGYFNQQGAVSAGKPTAPQTRAEASETEASTTFLDSTTETSRGRKVSLRIDGLFNGLPERAIFLEDKQRNETLREVLFASGNTVFTSFDNGVSWASHRCRGVAGRVVRCFTLQDGTKILQTSHPFATYLSSEDFRSIRPVTCSAEHSWHGAWSIDQSSSGTVCFGEYMDRARFVRVLRSDDGGANWEEVLVVENVPGQPTSIRHIHTVLADPFMPGRWYATSGDQHRECRFWISSDDARTWQELGEPNLIGDHPLSYLQERRYIYRFVSACIDRDYIYWPTDDLLRREGPALFRMSKVEPHEVEYICDAGEQEARSCIDLGGGLMLDITQSNKGKDHVSVLLLNVDGFSEEIVRLPKLTAGISSFCRSLTSRSAPDGVFFTGAGGHILDARPSSLSDLKA